MTGVGTMEIVFPSLWALFSGLYWNANRSDENLLSALAKVGCLLLFIYGTIRGFDWIAEEVPADQVVTFWGLISAAEIAGPRVPYLSNAFSIFVGVLLLMVVWYARGKVSTVGAVILSTWDRGHWYMLPVIFILMTVGLLLVAAAAAPVLSPFVYTLF